MSRSGHYPVSVINQPGGTPDVGVTGLDTSVSLSSDGGEDPHLAVLEPVQHLSGQSAQLAFG